MGGKPPVLARGLCPRGPPSLLLPENALCLTQNAVLPKRRSHAVLL
jgi:hypothetical protein